ncbi:ATP-binding protein [Streptomyces sp. TR06-5]|uniref:ATP-binding protein n=1 Tax=unclassified Streptomyces TaxID=2593676 RepID=UPI00399F3ED3
MKHGTLKTLGVTALGAAFAASGAGAASAADAGTTVETASKQLLAAPPVQEATGGGDSVGRMPTSQDEAVAPSMAEDVAAAEGDDGAAPQKLLGGLPIAGQLAGNGLPTDTVTDAVGGGLPTQGLPLGGGLPLG